MSAPIAFGQPLWFAVLVLTGAALWRSSCTTATQSSRHTTLNPFRTCAAPERAARGSCGWSSSDRV